VRFTQEREAAQVAKEDGQPVPRRVTIKVRTPRPLTHCQPNTPTQRLVVQQ